jgi:hypothetical protein
LGNLGDALPSAFDRLSSIARGSLDQVPNAHRPLLLLAKALAQAGLRSPASHQKMKNPLLTTMSLFPARQVQ